ncbi:hypothetical protein ACFXD5_19205 [Streptomyces sp. NPDC059385]
MIGLLISMIRMSIWACLAMVDMMFAMCTLGKFDPKTRKFV